MRDLGAEDASRLARAIGGLRGRKDPPAPTLTADAFARADAGVLSDPGRPLDGRRGELRLDRNGNPVGPGGAPRGLPPRGEPDPRVPLPRPDRRGIFRP